MPVGVSQTKKRGAVLLLTILGVVIAVAIFVSAEAWIFVPAALIVLAMHLASPLDDEPDVPNSPFKVLLYIATACGGVVLIVLGLTSQTAYLTIGALLLFVSLPALWMVRQGRNPWWMRGWADYWNRR
jgi:predicted MFS family arabinose efflux permease